MNNESPMVIIIKLKKRETWIIGSLGFLGYSPFLLFLSGLLFP